MPHQSSVSSKKIDAKPSVSTRKSPSQTLKAAGNGEERFLMISEAAYYRALSHGFDGGDSVQDWLMAEMDIDGVPRHG